MAKEDTSSKMLTILLAIIISIAAIVFLYVNLTQDTTEDETSDGDTNGGDTGDNETEEPETLLTVTYNNIDYEYSLEDLEELERYEGKAKNIKLGWLPEIKIVGPINYTGVRWNTLISDIGISIQNYSISVVASDDYTKEYNNSMIEGNIKIYNETTGNKSGIGNLTLLIAYKEENQYITEDGPIKTVYVDSGMITSSRLKVEKTISIEIKEN